MLPPQQKQDAGRIDLRELKAQIVKRIGRERANQYFAHFRRFISSHLGKQELDKLVLLTIGRQNVALHNQLVRAILNNAVHAQLPPPAPSPSGQDLSKPVKGIRRKPSLSNDDAFLQPSPPHAPPASPWGNGDSLLPSPRKGRSGIGDRKARKDRPGSFAFPRELAAPVSDAAAAKIGVDEEFKSPDLLRPLQEDENAAQQQDAERISATVPPVKRLRILPGIEQASIESIGGNSESFPNEQEEFLSPPGNFIRAPLGIRAAARKPAFPGLLAPLLQLDSFTEQESLDNSSELPDAETMHKRMQHIASMEGLGGVSHDCADLLNHALDALLTRLIRACLDLVGSKPGREQAKQFNGSVWDTHVNEGFVSGKKLHQGLNGMWSGPAHEFSTQIIREKTRPPISLADFKVAMDLNPQQLGEDWPVQLEKLSFRLFDH